MKVEIWSDFVCPFCYIGKRRFEEALSSLPFRDDVEVVYRSFELDPRMEKGVAHNVMEALAKKYGMSVEQARQSNASLAAQAEQVGLTYNYEQWKFTNTFDAHRLAHFAGAHGKANEMTERLMYAYFTEAKHLGEPETLADLAAEIGLDREAALRTAAAALKSAPDEVPARVAALVEERRRLERELAEARRALALGGGQAREAAGPEDVAGTAFIGQVLEGVEPKQLRGLVDEAKARVGSGVVALIAVTDGRASIAAGVTPDLTSRFSAVDLVRTAVATLGGQGGGGRPDMAQGGGPEGSKAAEALDAIRSAIERLAVPA